ncbi:hypothetical protein PTSG_07187 [Salpingoeca rosetta]|uniref:GOLD domain-containing protein n=1 Tax=Salpingoeca rosetta (strain ATCC 50818 / BSB-021) TaxID=946362 RepID=F2UEB2_SALR5|nr:uncharacterized protein PTSG_07187 [Salpingoeca rosetta]EGD74962.1 hypothetical protein PTSG_07187 [Salpingoeca rosetta]|eukprot:XP_004992607.1 hypothetical protein PTSG_07187 [Salpingoeca rosetta]
MEGCVGLAAVVLLLAVVAQTTTAAELTFDMNPHETQCFYDIAEQGTMVSMEYQVVYGGRLDIDVEVRSPSQVIWARRRSQADDHRFRAPMSGEYAFCFSNKFSTVTHKTVYLDVTVGNKEQVIEEGGKVHDVALTQIETSISSIHNALSKTMSYQTHLRMREMYHRHTAEFMNERVQWVSGGEALALVVISVFQVLYLKSLFTDRPNRF